MIFFYKKLYELVHIVLYVCVARTLDVSRGISGSDSVERPRRTGRERDENDGGVDERDAQHRFVHNRTLARTAVRAVR